MPCSDETSSCGGGPENSSTGFVADIVLLADHHSDPTNVLAWTRDPNDDYLVALTVDAGADLICSGDRDFEDVHLVEVLTPRALLSSPAHLSPRRPTNL